MNIPFKINGLDAKATWGLSLSDGALEALMTPASMKERIKNKGRLSNGSVVISTSDTEKRDERTISLPVHFTAASDADFISKYASFCQVMYDGRMVLTVTPPGSADMTFVTYYESCTQYSHYYGGIAKFVLKLYEPNPAGV